MLSTARRNSQKVPRVSLLSLVTTSLLRIEIELRPFHRSALEDRARVMDAPGRPVQAVDEVMSA